MEIEVAIVAKLRLGVLWRCARKLGSQSALARHLGIAPATVGLWLAMADYPRCKGDRRDDLDVRLAMLGAPPVDEIWPQELQIEIDQRKGRGERKWASIEAVRSVPVEELTRLESGDHVVPMLQIESDLDLETIRERTIEALRFLKPREATVLRLRYGVDGPEETLDCVAKKLGLTRERIRQIQARGERRLAEVPGLAAVVGLEREKE